MPNGFDPTADNFADFPCLYPGSPIKQSALLSGEELHTLELLVGRRLGQARLCRSLETNVYSQSLNEALLLANAVGVDQRVLTVAVGSNASAAVMLRKFRDHKVSTVVPFFTAQASGLVVGQSGHVSPKGYLAATGVLTQQADETVALVAALLDREQLAALNDTEKNYRPRWIPPSMVRLEFANGEVAGGFLLYDSSHGALSRPGHPEPRRPLQVTQEPVRSQEELLRILADGVPGLAEEVGSGEPREMGKRLSESEELRDAVHGLFREHDWVMPTGFAGPETPVVPEVAQVPTYGQVAPHHLGTSQGLRVLGSPDDSNRRGEQVVILPPDGAKSLGSPTHVTVSSPMTGLPPVIARLLVSRQQERGTAGVDQVIRNALGIELQEQVHVRPLAVPSRWLADRVIARPHFGMLRVQAADLTTVERDVALVNPLAMNLLGLSDGDMLVLQGVSTTSKAANEVRLRAFCMPDSVRERREEVSGGSLDARFPSSSDALGVFPDLPWIFLDSAVRRKLGLEDKKLAAVRARASRTFQLERELREMMLVLALAVIGVATVVDRPILIGTFIGLVVIASLGLVLMKIRRKLELNGSKLDTRHKSRDE